MKIKLKHLMPIFGMKNIFNDKELSNEDIKTLNTYHLIVNISIVITLWAVMTISIGNLI